MNLNRRTQDIWKAAWFYSLEDNKPLITGFNNINCSNAEQKSKIAFKKRTIIWKVFTVRRSLSSVKTLLSVLVLSYSGKELWLMVDMMKAFCIVGRTWILGPGV
jgi:hypothetical protein